MYRIRLQEFEGPLDLLLFFIRRDELDIYDIPIAQITDEFLEFVRVLEKIDLDGVADFIYMAAVLISIKARMLLPSTEVDEEGEPVDPRRELVERLLEYIRYKEAGQELSDRYERRAELFTRGAASAVLPEEHAPREDEVLLDVSVFDLISALRRVLTLAPEEPVHAVERFEYSVEGQQEYVLTRLRARPACPFSGLVEGATKGFVIATFLAVLELARQGRVDLLVEEAVHDFVVTIAEAGGGHVNGETVNGTHHGNEV